MVVKIDADLQHDPTDILSLIEPIMVEEAELVYGDRFDRISYKMPLVHCIGNRVFSRLMRSNRLASSREPAWRPGRVKGLSDGIPASW